MKISCIFIQTLSLTTLLILTCESKPLVKRGCYTARIMTASSNLMNKTAEFIKRFPDNIISIQLLTDALKKDFMENCSTRLSLLSFYSENVLSVGRVLKEAEKSGINEDFRKIEDLLRFCPTNKCELMEETERMKEFRNKLKKMNMEKRLRKAVSEIDTLLDWIDSFIHDIKKKEH
ncbi:interleukin-26 [Mixophyes fleayi]|uniref:interleukin-26 n=1 Tax=Mixophyes fleayi TaxID=3061075 RepID=UPI003F4DEC6F